jgi:hypothetical protein
VAEVKDRIRELVDQLSPEVAVEVERLLSRLAGNDEEDGWGEVSLVAFAALFDDTEVVYTEDDLPPAE